MSSPVALVVQTALLVLGVPPREGNTYDRFVFGMMIKAGSTQATNTLNHMIPTQLVCDDQMKYCQWAEPGQHYLLHHRGSIPSGGAPAVAAHRYQSTTISYADIARLPWVQSGSVFHPADSRTFKIMLVREPCDYTASVWKYSAVSTHHSRLAATCAERAGAMNPRHVSGDVDHDPSYLDAWGQFVNKTAAPSMHWFGFRLASYLLGLDFEHFQAHCVDRNAPGTAALCDTENHAACPQEASSQLEARLSTVLDHLVGHDLSLTLSLLHSWGGVRQGEVRRGGVR